MAESTTKHGLSRRSFIKGAAAFTAAGALAGCSAQTGNLAETGEEGAQAQAPETQIYSGVCRGNCAGGCFLNVHVRDGQIVRTTARDMPNPDYNRVCSKGLTHVGRIYSADRLQYPMKRVGERGEGKFERISWDEAIEEIGSQWKSITDQYGPGAMGVMYASGNYAVCSGVGLGGCMDRFINVTGATYIHQAVDAAHGHAFGLIAGMTCYGTSNEPADFKNAKTFICWGANPSVSQPQTMHFIMDAQKSGTKLVVIDPVFNATAAKADWFVPIKAGTDGVLGFGLISEILAQGWVDEEFMKAHTEAPALINPETQLFMRMSDFGVAPTTTTDPATGAEVEVNPIAVWDNATGAVVAMDEAADPALEGVAPQNGVAVKTAFEIMKEQAAQYPLEKVEQITGIPASDVKELARIYHEEGPCFTYSMFGCDHYINGHYNYWPMYLTSWLTGNVGKPGAACGFAEAMPLYAANMAATLFPVDAAGNPCQGSAGKIMVTQVLDVINTGTFAGEDYPLKGVYLFCANPMVNMADHEYTASWLKALDFLVVCDLNMTETALYADILLPSAHWFEQTDLFTSYASHPYLLLQEQCTTPLYESKPDFEIFSLLADKLGYGEFWPENPEAFIQEYLGGEGAQALDCTYDKLMSDKALYHLPATSDAPFVSFEGGVFGTASGRGAMFVDAPALDYNIGQTVDASKEKFPYWEPAAEASEDAAVRETYPFHLISEHSRVRTHSQWWEVGYLTDIFSEPVVKINTDDAASLGIAEGDMVRLYNDRGSVVMKATITAGNPAGTLSAVKGWQADEFVEGHFASLPMKDFNQVCANQAFNDVAVAIEKA